MANKKTTKISSCKCPKCKAKLVVTEFTEYCRRCGYSKHREASNLTKKLYGF